MLDQDRPRPSSSKTPSKKKKVEQEDNKMERPPPPTPWGSRVPSPCPSRAPSEKNKVEQVEDKKTKQKEDTEKSGVKASVCLDSDTSDDEEQKEKDMAVDHRQKEGEAVVKCEAYRAAESRADMLKEKARQLKATKHWAPVPGEKEFENVRRMSIAATQREEAQMRTPSPQRGRAPSRSRAPSPERREPHSEAIARAACRAASANRSSNDRRPEMPLPIRGVPAPDDTSDVPPGYFEKKKKKVQVEQQKDKDPAEALQKREAQANRADTSIVTLCWTLLEFLTYVLRETWIVRSSEYHATEQAKSQKNSISDRYSPGRDNYDSDEEVLAGNCCNERKKGRTASKDWGGPTTGSDTDRTFLTDDPKRGSKPRSRSNSYENVVINPQQLRGRKRSRKGEDPKQNAPDQAQSSGHATEQTQSQRYNISEDDCENIVFDTFFGKFFEQFYDEPALLLHKHMWDIMSRALAKHTILQVRLVLLMDGLMRTELLCMSAFIGKTRCGT